MGTPLFNFRADEDVIDAYKDAAEAEGMSASAWAREVLSAVASGGITLGELSGVVAHVRRARQRATPRPVRPATRAVQHLAVQVEHRTLASQERKPGCQHPPTARRRTPFTIVCGLCGAVVKNL